MPRSRGAVPRHDRHKKIFKEAKGYFGGRKNLWRIAKDAVEHGWEYAYQDRKKKKRNFRRLWIARINAAARINGTTYSRLISLLKKANVLLDRKILSELAIHDPTSFGAVVKLATGGAAAR